jgi:signal transduction histidine kinase
MIDRGCHGDGPRAVGSPQNCAAGSSRMDMALSTSIIDAHRGRVRAEPNKSYGATVRFTPPSHQTVGLW